ncbi:MAG: hypothetical protein JST90_13450 [Bacteroidetes bacterium]|nr:hypothetical protein [Bacteroidota bacterium]
MNFWKSIALALIPIAVIALRIYQLKRRADKQSEDPRVDDAEVFRQNAIRVHVDYALCVIRDSSYSYEQSVAHGRVAAMNVLSGDEMSNIELRTQSQLLLQYPCRLADGADRVYQIPIYGMTKDNFDMRFISNDIYLYISTQDHTRCMLDMGDRQMWGQCKEV